VSGTGPELDAGVLAWRLAATLLVVLLNGFFVAAEFALVKVRGSKLRSLAEDGGRRAKLAAHIHGHLDRYLSACQLGITIASLVLGWLAEPAVAEGLLAGAAAVGWVLPADDPFVHGTALALALTVVTFLHMTLGEQAPKLWAIHRAEATALRVALPLRVFERTFRPFIGFINAVSNGMLRLGGVSAAELAEPAHGVEEIRSILATSARAGHISDRQLELVGNILGIMELEVRHILVPRVDVEYLSLQKTREENLRVIRESGHSRLPLCQVGLDTVLGIVHAKDVMAALAEGGAPDLKDLARNPILVPDTQPLSRFIVRLQRARSHCAVVLDEHGTAVGLAFLEDALEEIVGPIGDEFDAAETLPRREGRAVKLPGNMALPEAAELLEMPELAEDGSDTIGGHVVALLGRFPRKGDEIEIGEWHVVVEDVVRRRIQSLRFEPLHAEEEADG
jgi:CBS domain containing-hemolysin-like protein